VALLPVPQPYDFSLSMERFRAFGLDLAFVWRDGCLRRAVAGREVRIEAAPGGVRVEPFDAAVAAEVSHLLGLPFELEPFRAFAAAEPTLARLVAALPGFRPPLLPDPFEMLVTSITAQQVSLHAARAIRNRLLERYGDPVGRAYAFPPRERLASLRDGDLVALGFSRRKAEYVLGLARAELDLRALAALPDGEVAARLTEVRGLGRWTADWFLARHLARPTAWPAGDLALRKAVSAFYGEGRELTTEEVRAMGDRFAPFQNLTAHTLLTGLRTVGG